MKCNLLMILVTFNPDWEKILTRVESFKKTGHVFISDNSSVSNCFFKTPDGNVTYHYNDGNVGIAKAQNVGIEYAIQNNFELIAFIDDDSDLNGEKILSLVSNFHSLNDSSLNIAAYCALPSEQGGMDRKYKSNIKNDLFMSDNLMSSGSLTPTKVFKDIGLFKEKLFIDFVDYEWGWRALTAGYTIVIDASITFTHKLGSGKTGVGLGIPSPVRHFYQTRNLLWVSKLNYTPLLWKIKQLILLPVRFILFGFLYKEAKKRRAQFIKGLAAGFKDGL